MFKNPTITINQETCTLCMGCVDLCPSVIYFKDDKNQIAINPVNSKFCITCGQCMSVCATRSVQTGDMNYDRDFFGFSTETITYDSFASELIKRRSVRSFSKKPIEKEIIDKVTGIFRHAPYGVAPLNAEVTIINDRKKIEETLPIMRNFYDRMGKLDNAMGRFIFKLMVNKEVYRTMVDFLLPIIRSGHYKYESGDTITRGAPAIILFHGKKEAPEHTADSWILCNYAMISAHFLGLGSTIIGLVPPVINQSKEVRKIFGIPEGHDVVCSLILGYPKHKYQRGFKAIERIIHNQ
jgi:NAD-dependent dihydropyrimidine dehydrogenase PreA subunit/nitroreductase